MKDKLVWIIVIGICLGFVVWGLGFGSGGCSRTLQETSTNSSTTTTFGPATGVLDASFGVNGLAIYEDGSVNDMVVDPSGRILVVGAPSIWCFGTDGKLDPGFGEGGIVTDDRWSDWCGSAVTVAPEGKIYAAGGGLGVILFRYDPNGNPDSSFGTGGAAIITNAEMGMPWTDAEISSVATDSSGRIVVAGNSTGAAFDLLLWRFNPNGSPDTGFGSGGMVKIGGARGVHSDDYVAAMTIDPSGNILVAGYSKPDINVDPAADYYMVIWKFDSGGNLSKKIVYDGAIGSKGKDIMLDSSGKIVVTGDYYFNTDLLSRVHNIAIWRYTADLDLDNTFGADRNGVARIDGGDREARGAIDPAGKILVTSNKGNIDLGSGITTGMTTWRYNADGTPDHDFGSDGKVYSPSEVFDESAGGYFVATDQLERVIIAGKTHPKDKPLSLAVWRYR